MAATLQKQAIGRAVDAIKQLLPDIGAPLPASIDLQKLCDVSHATRELAEDLSS